MLCVSFPGGEGGTGAASSLCRRERFQILDLVLFFISFSTKKTKAARSLFHIRFFPFALLEVFLRRTKRKQHALSVDARKSVFDDVSQRARDPRFFPLLRLGQKRSRCLFCCSADPRCCLRGRQRSQHSPQGDVQDRRLPLARPGHPRRRLPPQRGDAASLVIFVFAAVVDAFSCCRCFLGQGEQKGPRPRQKHPVRDEARRGSHGERGSPRRGDLSRERSLGRCTQYFTSFLFFFLPFFFGLGQSRSASAAIIVALLVFLFAFFSLFRRGRVRDDARWMTGLEHRLMTKKQQRFRGREGVVRVRVRTRRRRSFF